MSVLTEARHCPTDGCTSVHEREVLGEARPRTVIECAYHGWKFACDGTCLDVPHSTPSNKLRDRINVRNTYKTFSSSFDLIFVWLGTKGKEKPLPIPPRILQSQQNNHPSEMVAIRPTSRRFPQRIDTLIENLVDPGHVPFSHHGTSPVLTHSLHQ